MNEYFCTITVFDNDSGNESRFTSTYSAEHVALAIGAELVGREDDMAFNVRIPWFTTDITELNITVGLGDTLSGTLHLENP